MNVIQDYSEFIDKILQPPKLLTYKQHLEWILKYIKTDYVIFLAGDDIAHPNLIERYLNTFQRVGNIPAFICSPFYYINTKSKIYDSVRWPLEWEGLKNSMVDVFTRGPICNISSVAWKTELLRNIPLIPDDYGNCVDWYLYMLFSSNNPVYLVNKNLLFYRVHKASTGNSNVVKHTKSCKYMFQWLKEKNIIPNIDMNILRQNISSFDDVICKSNKNNKIKRILLQIYKLCGRYTRLSYAEFRRDSYLLDAIIKNK